jgi:hypothetical protein
MMTNYASDNTYYTGATVRFWVRDLTSLDDGSITSGADVDFTLYDAVGTSIATGVGVASGDDWYYDLTLPETGGIYRLVASAEKESVVWKGRAQFEVLGLP